MYGSNAEMPAYLAELARVLGIQVSTLSQIKKLPEFHEELVNRVRTKFRDHVPEMVPVLFARAQEGSIRAKRLIEKVRVYAADCGAVSGRDGVHQVHLGLQQLSHVRRGLEESSRRNGQGALDDGTQPSGGGHHASDDHHFWSYGHLASRR